MPQMIAGVSKKAARVRASELLSMVGLAERESHRPARLSGGEQQRVAIARALAMRPRILLFDEVTSALDPELVGEVLDTMRLLAEEGMTMICVTHEMGFARDVSDRVAYFDEGRVEEIGPPSQIFGDAQSERTR